MVPSLYLAGIWSIPQNTLTQDGILPMFFKYLVHTPKCLDDIRSIIRTEVHERDQLAVPEHQNPSLSITWKISRIDNQHTPNISNDAPIKLNVKIEADRNCFWQS